MSLLHEKSEREWAEIARWWRDDVLSRRLSGLANSYYFQRGDAWRGEFGLREIFDRDPGLQGRTVNGVTFRPPRDLDSRTGKLLVFATAYAPVKADLLARGLVEFQDFMRAADFLTLWNWVEHRRTAVQLLVTAPTLKCTLRCASCCMSVPRQPQPRTENLKGLLRDLDRLMEFVDHMQFLGILGGEPLLHPDLATYIEAALTRYPDQIGEVHVTTNGTVAPGAELLRVGRERRVFFSVSDYSSAGLSGYAEKLARTLNLLRENGVAHKVAPQTLWNPYFSDSRLNIDRSGHYRRCLDGPRCPGFNGGKISPCLVAWGGDQCGLVSAAPGDFTDLRELDPARDDHRLRVVTAALGRGGPLPLCDRCYGGDAAVWPGPVPAAAQEVRRAD